MTNLAHTPGPWETSLAEHITDRNKIVSTRINGPHKGIVATAYGQNRDIEQCDANARLIAAAPDLLAALESMTENLSADPTDYHASFAAKLVASRAAIAKAKGGA